MAAVVLGLLAGFLSGHFGVGGGLITTPGIRLLHYPPYIAVGTPLLANIPTALSGAWSYNQQGYVDRALAIRLGCSGALGAVAGSLLTPLVNPHLILVMTAVVIGVLSLRFFTKSGNAAAPALSAMPRVPPVAAGLFIGLASGFLGLGGGFLLIPYMSLYLKKDIKTTFGTSLAAIAAITAPGALVHWALGHVDLPLALAITAGVIPGSLVGAKVALSLREDTLRLLFGVLLLSLAAYLGYSEVARLV